MLHVRRVSFSRFMTIDPKTTQAPEAAKAKEAPKASTSAPAASASSANDKKSGGDSNRRNSGGRQGGNRRGRGPRREREPREFEQVMLDLARVTRVTKGGKRMRFRAALVIGDKKGRVGFGLAKGVDVQLAIQKAYHQAKKNVITLDLVDGSFPHRMMGKFGAADVLVMPAPEGTGLKAGGAVRMILELAGVTDAVGKILGSKNKINVAKATFDALQNMEVPEGVMTDKKKTASARKEKKESAARKVTKSTEKK